METTTHSALVFLASLFIRAGRKSIFSNTLTVPQMSSHFSPDSCYILKRLDNYHCLCRASQMQRGTRLGTETALVCQTRCSSAISGSSWKTRERFFFHIKYQMNGYKILKAREIQTSAKHLVQSLPQHILLLQKHDREDVYSAERTEWGIKVKW